MCATPPAAAAWAQRAMAARPDRTAVLERFDAPVSVVVGAEDSITPLAEAEHELFRRFHLKPDDENLNALLAKVIGVLNAADYPAAGVRRATGMVRCMVPPGVLTT